MLVCEGACPFCGYPWVKRDGDHADWCQDARALLQTERPLVRRSKLRIPHARKAELHNA